MATHGLLAAALAASLALAACGRKTGLDAPPLATAGDSPQGAPGSPAQPQAVGPDGKPLPPPPAEKQRIPILDWLIN